VDRAGRQGWQYLSWERQCLPKPGRGRRRPWFTWAPPFAVILAILCFPNRFLFTRRLYEQGDAGANSILITQAKHFTLLVGNYSREGFNHPGPAYLYVQAAGEWLLDDTLHLFTSQFICTPAQERAGVRYTFDAQRPQAGALLHFSTVWVTAGSAARGGTTPR